MMTVREAFSAEDAGPISIAFADQANHGFSAALVLYYHHLGALAERRSDGGTQPLRHVELAAKQPAHSWQARPPNQVAHAALLPAPILLGRLPGDLQALTVAGHPML